MGKIIYSTALVCFLVASVFSQGFNGVGNAGANNGQWNNVQSNGVQSSSSSGARVSSQQATGQASNGAEGTDCDEFMRALEDAVRDVGLLNTIGVADWCKEEAAKQQQTGTRSAAVISATGAAIETTPLTTTATATTTATTTTTARPQQQAETTNQQSQTQTTTQAPSPSTTSTPAPRTTSSTPPPPSPTTVTASTRRNTRPPGHSPNTRPRTNAQPTTTQSTTTPRQPTTTQRPTTNRQRTTQPRSSARQSASKARGMSLLPNNCGVRVMANADCREFNGQRCGAKTRFDIDQCVCTHEVLVNPDTCRRLPPVY